jgi:DNA-binding response OmpR family regulator
MINIITIEDDAAIRRGIRDSLRFAGYRVEEFGDVAHGIQAVLSHSFELLLLDLVLPDGSGLDALSALKRHRPNCPVIILSAKGEEADRVRGLRAGADDYVTKPFGIDELLARVEAVLRRSPSRSTTGVVLRSSHLSIDLARCEISDSQSVIESLTPREAEVLSYLAIHSDRAVSRDEMLSNVWQIDPRGGNTRVVDITISRLREKLAIQTDAILTVHGKGYALNQSWIVLTQGGRSS